MIRQHLHRKFCIWDTNLEDRDGWGHPSAIDEQHLETLVEQYPRQNSSENLWQWVSTFQQYWIIAIKLVRWRNSINGFQSESKGSTFWCLFDTVFAELEWVISWSNRKLWWKMDPYFFYNYNKSAPERIKHFIKPKLHEQIMLTGGLLLAFSITASRNLTRLLLK